MDLEGMRARAEAMLPLAELRDYVGVGEDHDGALLAARDFAVCDISAKAGGDWTRREDPRFWEAVRAQVWLSFYGARDGTQNTSYLTQYLQDIICTLQLRGDADGL